MESPPKADASSSYYGYLFDEKKRPTQVMDALLRGIANYIVESIGDCEDRSLSPPKLAAFYKAVGGNYDSMLSLLILLAELGLIDTVRQLFLSTSPTPLYLTYTSKLTPRLDLMKSID